MSNLILAPVWKMKLKPSPKFVAVSLADQANDDGYCWPGIESISRRTCISKRTVQESLRYLEEIRLIKVIERPGKSNGYQFNMEMIRNAELFDGVDTASESVAEGVRNSQGCETRRGAKSAPRGAKFAGEGCEIRTQTINNHQEPSGGRPAPARETRIPIPEDWQPAAATRQRCTDAGYPPITKAEIVGFIAHHNATERTFTPPAIEDAFVSWMHKAVRFNTDKPGGGTSSRPPGMPNFRNMSSAQVCEIAKELRVGTRGKPDAVLFPELERAWRQKHGGES